MSPELETIAFFHAAGKAIVQWSFVEKNLRDLLFHCMSATDRSAIVGAYLSIENFRSKLKFCDNIISAKTAGTPGATTWAGLQKKVGALSKARNAIVHGVVVGYPNGVPGRRLALEDMPPEVGSGINASRRGNPDRPPTGALCLRDLDGRRGEFLALANSLRNFSGVVLGLPEPIPKSHELPARPMTIHKIEAQMRAALGAQPKPSRKKPSTT
jgi:hypothetical protein